MKDANFGNLIHEINCQNHPNSNSNQENLRKSQVNTLLQKVLFKFKQQILNKNTVNHISAANFIKKIQETTNVLFCLFQFKEIEMKKEKTAQLSIEKEIFPSKNSTESEKSDDKNYITFDNQNNNISMNNIPKDIENLTKNQLNLINEIVFSKCQQK